MKFFFILISSALLTWPTAGQDSLQPRLNLTIGLTETPPFVMEENGDFSGLSIASWKLVNNRLNADYSYKIYPHLDALRQAIRAGEIDLSINPITVTDQRMQYMDFSQPYFISHTAIAKKTESSTWKYLMNILSWDFISALLILVGVIFIFGFLVWIFERNTNQKEFAPGRKGIFQGFWWSAVTMTTVGYGDKSPRTFGGRLVGLIWMFLAIIMISSLTAGIASSLTVRNIEDKIDNIDDLEKFEVTTVRGSSSLELLNQYNIQPREVVDVAEGIQQVLEGDAELLVYDQPILDYFLEQNKLQDEVHILTKTLKKDYYSYSFPENSSLVDTINPILIATLKTMEWNELVKNYK